MIRGSRRGSWEIKELRKRRMTRRTMKKGNEQEGLEKREEKAKIRIKGRKSLKVENERKERI